MFIDASALTAILVREPDADMFAAKIEEAGGGLTSPMTVWETAIAIARVLRLSPQIAGEGVLEYLRMANIDLVPIPADAGLSAIQAFERFGKGRHKAALNFGDCFAYALSRPLGIPLLFKGDDFSLTDVLLA